MASPQFPVIIGDDEEALDLEQGRPRRPRSDFDYTYQGWENMMDDAAASGDATERPPVRKRKRKTMDGESIALIFEDACERAQKTFERKLQKMNGKLRDSHRNYQKLQENLRQEQAMHQKTKEELSKAAQRRIFQCPVCYAQPDHWVTLLCGHLFCQTCNDTWSNPEKTCPTCREPIKGHVECKPYAG